jgi:hypothetical protein
MATRDHTTLAAVRNALLVLHKALLDFERLRYERDNGRIESNAELLKLVTTGLAFAWLRQMSALIVEIDEKMEAKEPLTPAGARALLDTVRALVSLRESDDEFHINYQRAIQDDPDVVIHHVRLSQLLLQAPTVSH